MAKHLRTLHVWLTRKTLDRRHQAVVDVVLAAAASYAALKKPLDLSITAFFESFLNDRAATVCVIISAWVCGYAGVMKVVTILLNAFPATRVRAAPSEPLAQCALTTLNELRMLHAAVLQTPALTQATFRRVQHLERNIASIVDSMADQIRSTLNGAGKRDFFVSLYEASMVDNGETLLRYVYHYPIRKDGVVSREIDTRAERFKNYECVKCLRSPLETIALPDCRNYFKSNSKRHRKIQHYIGMKLRSGDMTVGFLNIEFYNQPFFNGEDEMYDYIEENLLSYRYHIEYQLVQRGVLDAISQRLPPA